MRLRLAPIASLRQGRAPPVARCVARGLGTALLGNASHPTSAIANTTAPATTDTNTTARTRRLVGPVPYGISLLSYLTDVDASSNKLTGGISNGLFYLGEPPHWGSKGRRGAAMSSPGAKVGASGASGA